MEQCPRNRVNSTVEDDGLAAALAGYGAEDTEGTAAAGQEAFAGVLAEDDGVCEVHREQVAGEVRIGF